jgi:hypothetical protein
MIETDIKSTYSRIVWRCAKATVKYATDIINVMCFFKLEKCITPKLSKRK